MQVRRNRMIEDDLKLFSKALRHYSKRLTKLLEDEEIIEHGNGKIRDDIQTNSKKALEVADEMDNYKSENSTNDHVTWVKCALAFYKKDLKESMKMLDKKIGIKIPMKDTLDEIRYIEKIFKNRDWDEPTLDTEKN